MPKLATLFRTLQHLRDEQWVGQVRKRLRPTVKPRVSKGCLRRRYTPETPMQFLTAPPHASIDPVNKRIRLLNREVAFGETVNWDDKSQGPLFAYHLHHFDYLRDPKLDRFFRVRLIEDWLDHHPHGVGWDPHPMGLRIFNWLKLLYTPGAFSMSASQEYRMLYSLADQIETLHWNLETHLQANHLLSNLMAVAVGALLFNGRPGHRWRKVLPQLNQELKDQVLPDGGHYERSPMYHCLLLENLLDLIQLGRGFQSLSESDETLWVNVAERMLGALHVWTHPDGAIALMADSAFGIAQVPGELFRYAKHLGIQASRRESGALPDTGYVRLQNDTFSLLASVAGPMPDYQPGHAHCDALSFELCVGRQRIITDTGVFEYIPGKHRDVSRAVASHATIQLDGKEQAELWGAHRIGGRPEVSLLSHHPPYELLAHCRSWDTPNSTHQRRFQLSEEEICIEDQIQGEPCQVRYVLPIAPGVSAELNEMRLVLRGERAELRCDLPSGLSWRLATGPYYPEFGSEVNRQVLVGEADKWNGGTLRIHRLA